MQAPRVKCARVFQNLNFSGSPTGESPMQDIPIGELTDIDREQHLGTLNTYLYSCSMQ